MDKNKYSIEYDNVLNRTIYYKQHKLPNNKIVKPVEIKQYKCMIKPNTAFIFKK